MFFEAAKSINNFQDRVQDFHRSLFNTEVTTNSGPKLNSWIMQPAKLPDQRTDYMVREKNILGKIQSQLVCTLPQKTHTKKSFSGEKNRENAKNCTHTSDSVSQQRMSVPCVGSLRTGQGMIQQTIFTEKSIPRSRGACVTSSVGSRFSRGSAFAVGYWRDSWCLLAFT